MGDTAVIVAPDSESVDLAPRYDSVVVGGGITGTAAAYYLAASGAHVALLEQFDLNTQASGRNAGSLHGQIQHPPFLERGEEWAKAFLPALSFLVDSVALWRCLSEEIGVDLEVTTEGGLLVAETDQQMRDIERKVAIERSGGFESEVIGREDLRRLAPYVADTMIGAEFAPTEGVANPLLAAPAFARAAVTLGAAILTGVKVLDVERTGAGIRLETSSGPIRCERLVIASGSGVAHLAATLGATLPLGDEAVQLSVTEPLERFVHHLVYYAGGALTFKQAKAGSLLIGGGWPAAVDPISGSPRVSAESLRQNLRIAHRVVPRIGPVQVLRSWAGVVRNTPDLLPIIGRPSGSPDVIVGVYPHMGLTAGPLMGKVLARLTLGSDPGRDLAAFSPDRF
jgi:glycine/D-amino acid oxidase-like deaminating enzyme